MSSDRLKQMKERSKLRRQLLAQQLGAKDESDFSSILGKQEEVKTTTIPVIGNVGGDESAMSSTSSASDGVDKKRKLPGKTVYTAQPAKTLNSNSGGVNYC